MSVIYRQAAIEALRTCQTYLFHTYDPDKKISLESAEFEIEQLPSAQLIRCKDCKHYDDGLCRRWKYSHVASEESFCSGAERREERD